MGPSAGTEGDTNHKEQPRAREETSSGPLPSPEPVSGGEAEHAGGGHVQEGRRTGSRSFRLDAFILLVYVILAADLHKRC